MGLINYIKSIDFRNKIPDVSIAEIISISVAMVVGLFLVFLMMNFVFVVSHSEAVIVEEGVEENDHINDVDVFSSHPLMSPSARTNIELNEERVGEYDYIVVYTSGSQSEVYEVPTGESTIQINSYGDLRIAFVNGGHVTSNTHYNGEIVSEMYMEIDWTTGEDSNPFTL